MERDNRKRTPRQPGDSELEDLPAVLELTRSWRREADRISQREASYWTVQRCEIERRLEQEPSPMPRQRESGGTLGFGRPGTWTRGHSRFRVLGPVLTGSAVAVTLAVMTFSSVGFRYGPSDPSAPPVRTAAELRQLFADVGETLAQQEPRALAPAIPVRQALEQVWAQRDQDADSPWNSTVKLHLEKELR